MSSSWFGKQDKKPSWFLQFCYQVLRSGNIPKHVAFIMDGNRRFAKNQNISRKEGHSKGFDILTEVLQWCFELGISEVTVYAFSIENFKRSSDEVEALMNIFKDKLEKLMEEEEAIMKFGVCIRFVGDISLFNTEIQEAIAKVVNLTKDNNKSFLNIAMAYTSRDEITSAIKEIAVGIDNGKIKESDITEELIENCFYTNQCQPVDLLIRTSGEVRLSDFLLWQTSFSILCFIDVLWPALSVWDFFYCILKYQLGFSTMENAKELTKLKETRTQMDNDLKNAHRELKRANKENDKEVLNARLIEYTNERKQRTELFLQDLNEKRLKNILAHLKT